MSLFSKISIFSLLFTMAICASLTAIAQVEGDLPEFGITQSEVESHLRFLASDELKGRRTGEPGNDIAALYIAEQFRKYGIKEIEGQVGYFQEVPFVKVLPAAGGELIWEETNFEHGDNLMIMGGPAKQLESMAVFAEHGLVDEETGRDDYKNVDAKGKIVVVLSGTGGEFSPQETFEAMRNKRKIAAEKGALALIEIHSIPIPWPFFKRYFGRESIALDEQKGDDSSVESLVYGWVSQDKSGLLEALKAKKAKVKLKLSSKGRQLIPFISRNVVGWIEGTDPELKKEYVLLSAHFDHVGTGKSGGGAYTPEDSIFNGARDNAFGTTAMMMAARSLAAVPPKRSVILVGFTAEELGLLGSKYYADNPAIPLRFTVGSLNTDGAGYTDTDKMVFVGKDRVDMKIDIVAAGAKFGLTVINDPVPEQNLFERSDNASLAKKGVPAPALGPGFTVFDKEMMKYYHQVGDNPDTIDFEYLLRFAQAFASISRLLANESQRPEWLPGDRYEEASKKLYGTE